MGLLGDWVSINRQSAQQQATPAAGDVARQIETLSWLEDL